MSTECLCEYHGRTSPEILRVWSGWASTVIHGQRYEPDLGPCYAPGRGPRYKPDLGPRYKPDRWQRYEPDPWPRYTQHRGQRYEPGYWPRYAPGSGLRIPRYALGCGPRYVIDRM